AVGELHPAGALERRQPHAAVGDQVGGQGLGGDGLRSQLHDGRDPLPPFLVGNADGGGVGDGRMLEQYGVDLRRVDVDAARDDEVGAAVGEEEIALVVETADVAQGEV